MFSACEISAIGTLALAIIHVIFWNIRRSRCTNISCCCVSCSRQLMSPAETQQDELKATTDIV